MRFSLHNPLRCNRPRPTHAAGEDSDKISRDVLFALSAKCCENDGGGKQHLDLFLSLSVCLLHTCHSSRESMSTRRHSSESCLLPMHTPRRPDLQSRSEQGIGKGWCSNLRFCSWMFLPLNGMPQGPVFSYTYIYIYAQSKLETRISGGQHALAARKRHQEWFLTTAKPCPARVFSASFICLHLALVVRKASALALLCVPEPA